MAIYILFYLLIKAETCLHSTTYHSVFDLDYMSFGNYMQNFQSNYIQTFDQNFVSGFKVFFHRVLNYMLNFQSNYTQTFDQNFVFRLSGFLL